MIEFGKTLREAREAKGFSVSQLADATHILPQIIENLEREDFSKIVAPIYGRGFLKLYCETVGIDAKPLINEFMAIYNGDRPPVIRMKESEVPVVKAPVATDEPEPVVPEQPPPSVSVVQPEPPSPPEPPAQFVSPAPSVLPTPSAVPTPSAPLTDPQPKTEPNMPPIHKPIPCDLPIDDLPPIIAKPLSRPRTEQTPIASLPLPEPEDLPLPEETPSPKRDCRQPSRSHVIPEVPRRFWRFGLLICAAAVILTLIFIGCRALYRATMRVPSDASGTERPAAATKAEPMPAKASVPPTPPQTKPVKTPETRTQALEAKSKDIAAPRPPRKPIAVPPLYID